MFEFLIVLPHYFTGCQIVGASWNAKISEMCQIIAYLTCPGQEGRNMSAQACIEAERTTTQSPYPVPVAMTEEEKQKVFFDPI